MYNKRKGSDDMKIKKVEKEVAGLVGTIVLCVAAVAAILLILINTFDEKRKDDEVLKNKKPVINTYSASVFFGGKVDASENLVAEYNVNGEADYYGLLENIEPAITNNDAAIFQLDDVVVTDYNGQGVPTSFVDQFADIGFSMVSLASSGQLDLGEDQLEKSYEYWNNEALYTAGSKSTVDQTTEIYEKNGITFGVLAYTMPENVSKNDITKTNLMNVYNDQVVVEDIANLRNQVDVVLVYIDWNHVYSFEVSNEQHRIAKLLADSGADIVLGTNTGTIQPVEWIGGTIIYYSLGNLVTDSKMIENRVGMIGSLYIQKTVVDGSVTIEKSQPKADLTYMASNPSKVIMLEEAGYELDNADEVYAKYSSVITMLDDSIRPGGIK